MNKIFLRLFVMVLAISITSWTFNPELMADVLSDAQSETSLVFNQGDDTEHPSKKQDSCNHGCHVVNHLQGQTNLYFDVALAHTRTVFQEIVSAFSTQHSRSQLRPPRLLS